MTTITAGPGLIYIPSWSTSTNLGPLPTTTFPPDCLSSLWNFNTNGLGMPWTQMTQGCAVKTCCPSGNVYTEPWAWMTSYYSPGVCPEHYRSCPGPDAPSALKTAPGETIAFCCPTNYNCPNTVGGFFQYCQSSLSRLTDVIVMNDIFNQKTLSTTSWSLASGFGFSWQAVYPIQVRTRVGELQFTGTTSASPSPPLSQEPSSTSTSRGGEGGTNSSSGLSKGGLAGVVISATCSVLGLVFGISFKIYKHRKQVKMQKQLAASGEH